MKKIDLSKFEKHKIGNHTIYFEERYHRYFDKNGNKLISVTGISGVPDKSKFLVPWAAKMMALYLQENWDLKAIKTEKQKQDLIETAKREFRRISQEAKDIGKAIHIWVDEWIQGKDPAIPDDPKVVNGVMAFLEWQKKNKAEFFESEKVVYSAKYNYVGTKDSGCYIHRPELSKKKLRALIDIKSSKQMNDEFDLQITGYWLADDENNKEKNDITIIIRFDKETGDFEEKIITRKEYENDLLSAFHGALALKRYLVKKERENEE